MQALLLPLHDDWYAIELTRVREVVPAPHSTPLPGAAPALLGVFNLHGDVVPLFDTALLLGLPPGRGSDRVAIADTARGAAGLQMDGRPDQVVLGGGALRAERPGAIARYPIDGGRRIATLIDVDQLLDGIGR